MIEKTNTSVRHNKLQSLPIPLCFGSSSCSNRSLVVDAPLAWSSPAIANGRQTESNGVVAQHIDGLDFLLPEKGERTP